MALNKQKGALNFQRTLCLTEFIQLFGFLPLSGHGKRSCQSRSEGVHGIRRRAVPGAVAVRIQIPDTVMVDTDLCSSGPVPVSGHRYRSREARSEDIHGVCRRSVKYTVAVDVKIPDSIGVDAYVCGAVS